MNPPNTMFQLSGVHCRGFWLRASGPEDGLGGQRAAVQHVGLRV